MNSLPLDLIAREIDSIFRSQLLVGITVLVMVIFSLIAWAISTAVSDRKKSARRWRLVSLASFLVGVVVPITMLSLFADTIRGANPADLAEVDRVAEQLGANDYAVLRVGDAAQSGESNEGQGIAAVPGSAYRPIGDSGDVLVATVVGDRVAYEVRSVIE